MLICGRKLDPNDSNTYSDRLCITHYINEIDEDIYDETDVSLCEKCHEHLVRTRKNAVQQAEMKIYQNRNVKLENDLARICCDEMVPNDYAQPIRCLNGNYICPKCNSVVLKDSKVCYNCGVVFIENLSDNEKCCDNFQKGMETCTEKTIF